MKPPELTHWSVQKLHNHLLARRFAVPKLQRNFVWDPKRAAKLIDSIYESIPIGSLFLWEMDKKSANLIRQSAEVLPSFNSANPKIWFVIDGQQRLSVIYQAFQAEVRKNDAGREIDFSRLCFVVDRDREQADAARIVYRKPVGFQFVSLRDILASNWRRRMPLRTKAFLNKIKECRDRILSYRLPLVIVRSASLDEIGEVFIRVNSQGMRITNVDRAIALMGDLDVRAMADELRQKIREGGFLLGGIDPILMGFNLITERPKVDSDPPKLETMAHRWSKRIQNSDPEKTQFRRTWHDYQTAFLTAIDYLRKFHVYDESYLPSHNMLATLAVFFYHHRGQPRGHVATEIRKWFWATGVAQRYSGGGYHRNIVSDSNFFEALAKGKRVKFKLTELVDPVTDIQAHPYSAQSALSRAFFCLLASRSPLYLENAEPIELGQGVISPLNVRHRHHIFPKQILNGHFPAKARNSLCNICFLVSRDNTKIGMKRPRTYLAEYRGARAVQFNRVMKSHMIPTGKEESGVWNRSVVTGYKQFRKARLDLICREFEKAAGDMKLFRQI